jgi:hypothetical protein
MKILYTCFRLRFFTKYLITFFFLILLTPFQIQSQTISTSKLFEFYSGDFQKNIRISERIQEQWDLPNYFLQPIHYNANKDNVVDSTKLIKQVLYLYYKKNSQDTNTLELLDDGNHFDNEPNDGIYGNYLNSAFNEFETNEGIIDVQFDTIGIEYNILQPPVKFLPEIPKIISPLNQSIISSDMPDIYWEIDPLADGCGVILLSAKPVLGDELRGIVWEKEYKVNNDKLFSEKIPVHLLNKTMYTLIVWSFTNTKLNNNEWSRGAYSIEWCCFSVDTLQKTNDCITSQNFPNPFNSNTIIKYSLPCIGKISIKIFDITGREIITLVNQEQFQGEHFILWDGKNHFGNNVTSGIYFYAIKFNNLSIVRKIILAR